MRSTETTDIARDHWTKEASYVERNSKISLMSLLKRDIKLILLFLSTCRLRLSLVVKKLFSYSKNFIKIIRKLLQNAALKF